MRHETQVELTKAILRHIDARTTDTAPAITRNPIESYTSAEHLRREQEVLFRRYPQFIGLSCRLPAPGDYLVDDHTGVPILVVRDEEGAVNAFVNTCRHRGSRVAEGSGHVTANFACPYHGWCYDLAGRLVAIPHKSYFEGLEVAGHGLRRLPAIERDGLVWVAASADAAFDIDAHLGGLGEEMASYGFAGYHHYETRTLVQKMNWKTVLDTFLEPYHFSALHRATVAPIFIPNLCLFHAFGRNLRETLPRRTIVELRGRAEAEWDLVKHTAIVYILFPNTAFVMQADHVETWRAFPMNGRPDECVTLLDFYIPEPATSDRARGHWDRNMDLTIRTVVEEDFATGEGIQRGLSAGAQSHLTYGRNEPALAYYQTMVREALEEAGRADRERAKGRRTT